MDVIQLEHHLEAPPHLAVGMAVIITLGTKEYRAELVGFVGDSFDAEADLTAVIRRYDGSFLLECVHPSRVTLVRDESESTEGSTEDAVLKRLLHKAWNELQHLREQRDQLQVDNTRLLLENRKLKARDAKQEES